jgi:hypothetical protein
MIGRHEKTLLTAEIVLCYEPKATDRAIIKKSYFLVISYHGRVTFYPNRSVILSPL